MKTAEQAIEALQEEGVTFAACRGDALLVSRENGISPMLRILLSDPHGLEGAFAADRVIGKAAAFLLVYGKISGLHARLISSHAKEVLLRFGIPFTYEKEVPYIENRRRDGMCPMEKSVLEIEDPEEAFVILREKWEGMKAQEEKHE